MKERREIIKELSENYKSVTGNYNTFSLKKNKDLLEEITYYTSFLDEDADIKERLYLLENELDEKPKCVCCKKSNVTLVNTVKGYRFYCGQDCFTKINNMKFLERMEFFKDNFFNIEPCDLTFFKKTVDEHFTTDKGLNKMFVKELGIPITFKEISKLIYIKTKDFLPLDTSTSTLIYCTYNEVKEKPTCKVCGSDSISLISFEKGFEKYCSTTCSNIYNKDLVKEKMLEQHGVDNYFASKEFAEKRKIQLEQQKSDPNYLHHMKDPECIKKMWNSKKRNGTTNTSSIEGSIYEDLCSAYKKVSREYREHRYPFHCDFYIEDIDLFLEVQGYWTHGNEAFNPSNKGHLEELSRMKEKAIKSEHYKNAIETWTNADPFKRLTARNNSLNFLEVFSYRGKLDLLTQIDRALGNFDLNYTDDVLQKEMDYFNNTRGRLETRNTKNKIIFQFTPQFFEVENNLYKTDPIIRRKLIENRIKYLNKKEQDLSDLELLTGFKKSGLHYGFSHFSPLWIKYFIEKYGVSSIYDPCGGWGHRLVGTGKTEYIYNDIDERNVESVKNISNYFSMENKTFYNRDSSEFVPKEEYDAVFTCPPYYDLEDYTHSQTSHRKYSNYSDWLNSWWFKTADNFLSKKPKYIGIVLKENLVEDMIGLIENKGYSILEKSIVGLPKNGYLSKQNSKNKEFLVVLKRAYLLD